ncbi:hypothetical protein QT397_07985 [Microbulbifer sp. MKSA007]|nr:hypothetical protein QT397_07985 [Microbulbifer sp. MKSA007]
MFDVFMMISGKFFGVLLLGVLKWVGVENYFDWLFFYSSVGCMGGNSN